MPRNRLYRWIAATAVVMASSLADACRATESLARLVIAPEGLYMWPDYYGAVSAAPLDSIGRTAFRADNGSFYFDDYVAAVHHEESPAKLKQIARRNLHAVGTNATFRNFSTVTVSDSGKVAFVGRLFGPNIEPANEHGIWQEDELGELQLIARDGNPVPGLGGDVRFNMSIGVEGFLGNEPLYSANVFGEVSFHAHLFGADAVDSNDRAILVNGSTGFRIAARRGQPAPGVDDGGVFATFFRGIRTPTINDRGEVAFLATLDGTPNFDGIWSEGGGNGLGLVVQIGDDVPGGGASFATLQGPRINNEGEVSFGALLMGEGVNVTNDEVILIGGRGPLQVVAREGEPAPGAEIGTIFGAFDMME